jgi:hypothetical protein
VSSLNVEIPDPVRPEAVAAVYEALRTAVGPDVEINLSAAVYTSKARPRRPAPSQPGDQA